MSTGQPMYECSNCGDLVARRGMCPECAEVRRAAQVWVRDVTAEIRVGCKVELPQHVEVLTPLPTVAVVAAESLQDARGGGEVAPDMAVEPARAWGARERWGMATLSVPSWSPVPRPDPGASERVRLAQQAAEVRYERIKAWIPVGRLFSEAQAAEAVGCAKDPARLALRRLVAEGVLRAWPARGYAVAGYDPFGGSVADRVVALLRERGPMRMGEIATALGVEVDVAKRGVKNAGRTRVEDGRVMLRGDK